MGGIGNIIFYTNSLRNIQISQKQFDFLSPEFTRDLDIGACLVPPGLTLTVYGHDIQPIIENTDANRIRIRSLYKGVIDAAST